MEVQFCPKCATQLEWRATGDRERPIGCRPDRLLAEHPEHRRPRVAVQRDVEVAGIESALRSRRIEADGSLGCGRSRGDRPDVGGEQTLRRSGTQDRPTTEEREKSPSAESARRAAGFVEIAQRSQTRPHHRCPYRSALSSTLWGDAVRASGPVRTDRRARRLVRARRRLRSAAPCRLQHTVRPRPT